jgi:hypothetical protein
LAVYSRGVVLDAAPAANEHQRNEENRGDDDKPYIEHGVPFPRKNDCPAGI